MRQVLAELLVLIVEDELLVRLYAEEILREAGFSTLMAAGADEAISMFTDRADISVVFSDVAMPGRVDGSDLARIVRERWPPIGIVLTSGHDETLPAGMEDRATFLPKPYRATELIDAI